MHCQLILANLYDAVGRRFVAELAIDTGRIQRNLVVEAGQAGEWKAAPIYVGHAVYMAVKYMPNIVPVFEGISKGVRLDQPDFVHQGNAKVKGWVVQKHIGWLVLG